MPRAHFHVLAAAVILVLFTSNLCTGAESSETYLPPIQIIPNSELTFFGGPTSSGTTLSTTASGSVFALLDGPSRLVGWQSGNEISVELGNANGQFSTPTDLYADHLANLYVADPWFPQIQRFNHRLKQLPPVKPTVEGIRFEPVSVCRDRMGSLFVINQADGGLWRIDHDGLMTSMGGEQSRAGWLEHPRRVRYSESIDRLIVLDGDQIRLCDTFGIPERAIETSVTEPIAFAVANREIWILGDELSCVSLITQREVLRVPTDSLKTWKALPAADIAAHYSGKLFILPKRGNRVVTFLVKRNKGESR